MAPEPTTTGQAWQALQSRKGLVLLTAASAAAAAVVISLLIPPVYESRVVFQVAESPEGESLGAAARSLLPGTDPGAALHVVTLQSMLIRREVAAQVPGRRPEALEEATDVSVFRKAALQVRVLDTEAEMAARLANAYPEALERFLVQRRATRREASIAALDTQRSRALERAQAARAALGGFLQQQRTPSLQREQDGLLARWQQAQAELAAAELRSASLTQRLAATAQQVQAESLLAAGGLQSPVPALQRLAQELAALEVDLAAARAEYDGEQGALHPKVKALSARVQQRRQQLADESAAQAGGGAASAPLPADQLREQLRRELLELQRQRQSLGAEIQGRRAEAERLRRQLGDGQAPRLQEQQLQLQLENALREADLLGQRLVELNTQALRRDRQVLVLTEAVPAGAARFPNAVWNGLLGAGLGAVAGLYLALYSRLSGRARALPREAAP